MSSLLDAIVARKREEVARAREVTPLESLKRLCAELPRPRNFFRAVVDAHHHEETRIIAEIKRKSPSAGIIRADFDPVALAKAYHHAGAAAISCLTDEHDFGGKLEYIHLIREAVPLPVLRKDFIVDEYQVWEAMAAGADAVLLIAEVLSESKIIDLQILAIELGLTTLVEVHSMENLLKVKNHIGFPHPGYSLLGINNRDLSSMTTSITHTFRLAELVENRDVLVSESGITSREDLKRLREHGVNIALVGEYLMKQPDPGRALARLLGENE
ncbi:MAG: indole-3-glycerol phosphate synthase TrpC [Phycisphaerae bacterium]|nr:indole-3-glycerol phosphate synthase TrpC [Phycisphaerae bacterium]